MPDKLKNSKSASEVETETQAAAEGAGLLSAARKIYPIVKYGDPILEKPTGLVQKFDEELEQLEEDVVDAATGTLRARRPPDPRIRRIAIYAHAGRARFAVLSGATPIGHCPNARIGRGPGHSATSSASMRSSGPTPIDR